MRNSVMDTCTFFPIVITIASSNFNVHHHFLLAEIWTDVDSK